MRTTPSKPDLVPVQFTYGCGHVQTRRLPPHGLKKDEHGTYISGCEDIICSHCRKEGSD